MRAPMPGRGQWSRTRHANVGAAFGTAARASRISSNWETMAGVSLQRSRPYGHGAVYSNILRIRTLGRISVWRHRLTLARPMAGGSGLIIKDGRVVSNRGTTGIFLVSLLGYTSWEGCHGFRLRSCIGAVRHSAFTPAHWNCMATPRPAASAWWRWSAVRTRRRSGTPRHPHFGMCCWHWQPRLKPSRPAPRKQTERRDGLATNSHSARGHRSHDQDR